MSKRVVNTKLFKELVRQKGEYAAETIAVESKTGVSTVQKLMAGTYPSDPKAALRERLCRVFGVNEDDLFPLVSAKGKKQAS